MSSGSKTVSSSFADDHLGRLVVEQLAVHLAAVPEGARTDLGQVRQAEERQRDVGSLLVVVFVDAGAAELERPLVGAVRVGRLHEAIQKVAEALVVEGPVHVRAAHDHRHEPAHRLRPSRLRMAKAPAF